MYFGYLFATGLTTGAIYALIALGIVIVYRATNVVNFAHGEMFMLAGFFAWSAHVTFGLSYLASLAVAVAGAFAESALEYPIPHARSERCPARPNTCAVADAFAGAGHQRTEHAARRDGATRPAAAPGRPSDATRAAFCFPIPDRSLVPTFIDP